MNSGNCHFRNMKHYCVTAWLHHPGYVGLRGRDYIWHHTSGHGISTSGSGSTTRSLRLKLVFGWFWTWIIHGQSVIININNYPIIRSTTRSGSTTCIINVIFSINNYLIIGGFYSWIVRSLYIRSTTRSGSTTSVRISVDNYLVIDWFWTWIVRSHQQVVEQLARHWYGGLLSNTEQTFAIVPYPSAVKFLRLAVAIAHYPLFGFDKGKAPPHVGTRRCLCYHKYRWRQ